MGHSHWTRETAPSIYPSSLPHITNGLHRARALEELITPPKSAISAKAGYTNATKERPVL